MYFEFVFEVKQYFKKHGRENPAAAAILKGVGFTT